MQNNRIQTIEKLINTQNGREALIIGAGSTTKEYREDILSFIDEIDPFIVGINNMASVIIPDYHLWTDTQRFRAYGNLISPSSDIFLGQNIPIKIIKSIIHDRPYTLINYTDKEGIPIKYKNGKIYGRYRTAGNLAIMICHLMGAKNINIVGMDGYTKFTEHELVEEKGNQHCYGKGHTDTADYKTCILKDNQIKKVLHNIREYGILFDIITPTIYKEFYYDHSGLHIQGRRISK